MKCARVTFAYPTRVPKYKLRTPLHTTRYTSLVTPTENAALFRRLCESLGFVRVGFTPVTEVARHSVYSTWLANGHAGQMHYLHEQSSDRVTPARLLAGAKTVVTVALSYAHPDGLVPADSIARGIVARYARGADYHVVLKQKLHALAESARVALGRDIAYRACVDTAPLLEREMAHASGIGFIAKNTMLISPGAGSYVLLGELLVDVECEPGAPAEPRCGQCRACLDACPTGAFVDAYVLDARRCISYLTIENAGEIPRHLRRAVGTRIFGCDICQEVCPFNASAKVGAPELAPRDANSHVDLGMLVTLGAAQFRQWQKGSALRRIHRPQLQRNAAVALGNVGRASDLVPLVQALYSRYALVRAHAAWAVGEIGARENPAAARSLLRRREALETDPVVQEEIRLAALF